MGITGSKYRIATQAEDASSAGFEWLAMPGCSFGTAIKAENFDTKNAIGKGKFGLVFVAKVKLETDMYVAIKFIPKQVIYDTNSFDKIQSELDLLGKIDHPFSVYCFGAFDSPTCIGIVMEYAVGGELYHRMKQRIKFTESEAKFYFSEIASLLRYLHEELGIVYRDLKPENILIDYAGHVKVCDFGFATLCSKADYDLKDRCGTVMYIAPEIVNKLKHGYAVDWWALGCVLVEMVTGHAPFGDSDDSNKFEIFNNITEKTVRMPLFASGPLKRLVSGLLHKDQAQRFDWNHVSTCDWLKDVNWKDVEAKKIVPPWVPSNAANQPACVANFVPWSLALPAVVPNSEVQGYSRPLKLPKPRTGSHPSVPSAPLDGSPGLKGALKKSASTMKKSVTLPNSGPSGQLVSSPSNSKLGITSPNSASGKLTKTKSTKVAVETTGNDLDDPLDSAPPKPIRSKSSLRGGSSSINLLSAGSSSSAIIDESRPESAAKKKKQKSQSKLDRTPSQRT